MTRIFSLDEIDYDSIDKRLKPFLKGWYAVQQYKGQKVEFPGTWNSSIHPYKYFEEIKKPGDANYDAAEAENEIGLCLWAGWKQDDNKGASDDEIDIRLFIMGLDVRSGKNKVSAEIHKLAGADISLYYNNKLVTDFTQSERKQVFWWHTTVKVEKPKIWIDDMTEFQ